MQSPREHFIEREIGHVHFGPGRLFRRLLASLTEESFRLWTTAQSSVAAPASPKTQHLKGIPIWPWDISAVSFRRPRLTLPFCGLDANGSNLEVSCVQEALHVASEPELILERLMSPKTKFVSITLTRAGFYLDRDDTFLVEHPDIQHDLHAVRGRQFKTMYGFLRAAALYRLEHRLPPLVVVSFDNIFHNGASLRRCLFEFCRLVDPDSANLVVEALAEDVYRVPSLKALCPKPLIIRSGLADHVCPAQALFSESYRRVFIGMREHDCQLPSLLPPWTLLPDTVIFSSDLATLQTAQTRMGNGVNVCIAWLGAVIGARYIHEVLEHRQAAMLLQDIMMLEIVPTLPVPTQSELSLSNLAMATLARFTAKASRDPLLRLNNPTVTKVWQRIGPTLRHARRLGLPCPRLSFICQVWAQYEESFSLAEKRVVLQKLAIPWRSEAELQPMLAALQGRALPRSVSDLSSSSSSSSSLQPSQVCVLFNYEDTLAITEPHAHSLFAPSSQREEEDQCVLSQLPSMIQPTPGSTTVLEYFLHRRVPWGIVSNHSTPRVEACVYALQQQRYITARRIFSARSSLSECQPKPQPDIYQFAKEAMTDEICDGRRHRAPQIVFLAVEDSPAGVFAAKEAGVDLVIGFMGALELEAAKMKGQFDSSRLVKQREELQKAGAHLVLSNLEDLVWVYQNIAASLTCFGLNFR